ncbi:hypothetical protein D3C77_801150 [compost metagenome]
MDRTVIRPFRRSQLFHNHHPLRCADGELHRVSLDRADSNFYTFRYEQLQQLAPADAFQEVQFQQIT